MMSAALRGLVNGITECGKVFGYTNQILNKNNTTQVIYTYVYDVKYLLTSRPVDFHTYLVRP